ncbi:hypothetical protein F5Y10DRAFT_150008 [Nemania abortiva]|nr:hypothetical protein F5Y10DRAFT_150008 [Nemania abortiva]
MLRSSVYIHPAEVETPSKRKASIHRPRLYITSGQASRDGGPVYHFLFLLSICSLFVPFYSFHLHPGIFFLSRLYYFFLFIFFVLSRRSSRSYNIKQEA